MDSAFLIIAILISNKDEGYILEFIFRRDTDERIPYTDSSLDYLPEVVRKNFVDKQWQFNPINLQHGQVHLKIQDDAVLPILSDEQVGAGGFGTVWKTGLDADCQALIQTHTTKEQERDISGSTERAILDLVQSLKHPNIVDFLGSYTYRRTFNLLFRLASQDLKTFLYQQDSSIMGSHIIYRNMFGIAEALSQVHNFSLHDDLGSISRVGYHNDLKPANILVDIDRILLSDFGLSRMKPDDETSKTKLGGVQGDYLGPEAFDTQAFVNRDVGRSQDVWAFGCILSEVATFVEGKSVEAFREKRRATQNGKYPTTDHSFHLDKRVRPAVVAWLSELVTAPSDPLIVHLVNQIREIMNPHASRRPRMSEVALNLGKLALHSSVAAVANCFKNLMSPDRQGLTANYRVLYVIEYKRFEAWWSVYTSLHPGVQMEISGDLLRHVTELYGALKKNSDDDMAQSMEGLPHDCLHAIDQLCKPLPKTSSDECQARWIQNVCGMEDIDTLQQIRAMAMPVRYRWVGVGAAMKHMSMAISASIQYGQKSRYMDAGSIDYEESDSQLVHGSKTTGYLTRDGVTETALIEWKTYDASWKGHEMGLSKIMDDLVNLLDPKVTPRLGTAQHRIPNCLGYFHEPHNYRFGFVYTIEAQRMSDDHCLVSLNSFLEVLSEHNDGGYGHTDLGDYFVLAKELAACLFAVHQVGWLHKNLSSHHILFFCPDLASASRHIKFAFLTGFNDSRPEATGFTLGPKAEHKLFQHPDYLPGVAFRRTFDYYGLGIVLLELGLGERVYNMKKSCPNKAVGQEFHMELLDSRVPELGPLMGARYRDAVRFCLDAERLLVEYAGQFGPVDDNGIQRMFHEKVVELLSGCEA
ncbi:serine threonine kinase [Fusarium globosum]|uniref:Serine threonine kinase n=1 Tax=Fusarium globosum TaxID=78864 RepID=A0A8H5XUE6_9HYPO|nr:serine threonine kinase [Fusarium globosum]